MRRVAVLRPASTAKWPPILRECHRVRQRDRGARRAHGLAGGATPRAGELAISLERLTGIEGSTAPAHETVARRGRRCSPFSRPPPTGLLFPLDLGARGSCTIGGNIATNAGGIK